MIDGVDGRRTGGVEGEPMEGPGGRIAFVFVLLLGAGVWVFTTSPGYSLAALLGGLVVWEWGWRSRYRRRLRFVLRSRPQPRATGREQRTPAINARPARDLRARPLWNRPPGAPPL